MFSLDSFSYDKEDLISTTVIGRGIVKIVRDDYWASLWFENSLIFSTKYGRPREGGSSFNP